MSYVIFLVFLVVVVVVVVVVLVLVVFLLVVVVVVDVDVDVDDVVVVVIYFMSKTSKNTVFSTILVPVNEKHWYLRRFCSINGENRPKHCYLPCFFENA